MRTNKNPVKTIKDFLIAIKNNEFKADQQDSRGLPYAEVLAEDSTTAIEQAIDNKFVVGVEYEIIDDIYQILRLEDPMLTPSGEEYLRKQKFFYNHPTAEKILIGVISTAITLVVTHFFS
ncbi:hypothetical protein FQT01_11240 [Enterococcus faecalis]|uniref:hypothetical protein n=1 Tax=Enterococcus TaxID=1350 RepID=UPI000FFF132C|nr:MULTISPECIES: hypothetical protein [Enterococcus]EGO7801107.1 DUF3109 family protein [Enterococcus faecalis]MBO1105885.1 hypothetical protein [Enterococcus faecalis]MDL4860214.1 hypothetical protein [Enterococcus faecalis]MDL4872982.1 hypothetical protein [Enterococcus faecalis]MDL4879681.1 hypothetical protein [Enterococcus faecalis]